MKSTASPCRGERKSGTTNRAGSPVERKLWLRVFFPYIAVQNDVVLHL